MSAEAISKLSLRKSLQLDITFSALACSVVSLDAMDISGEQHLNVVSSFGYCMFQTCSRHNTYLVATDKCSVCFLFYFCAHPNNSDL